MNTQGGARPLVPAWTQHSGEEVNQALRSWPTHSRAAAEQLIHLYQLPQVISDYFLQWNYNSPWKKTTVYRNAVVHHFPIHHEDLVEQIVDYRVPVSAAANLAAFNGSLSFNRTRGEMTAWCSDESMNCIILNLAHDIILGQKSVDEARRKQAELAMALRLNWPVDYAESLHFSPSSREYDYIAQFAGDPDISLVKKGIAEAGRDVVHQAQRVLGS